MLINQRRLIVRKLAKVAPSFIKDLYLNWILTFKLALNYKCDFENFFKWSSLKYKINYKLVDTQTKLKALITMDYHRLEKGLALKEPRVGFGEDVLDRLIKFIPEYQEKYGSDETILVTLNCLDSYYQFNLTHGIDNQELYQKTMQFRNNISEDKSDFKQGGILNVTKTEILEHGEIDLTQFFHSRYSIRHFSEEEVNISLIEKAMTMAQKTPSVCNRQSCRVYMFSDEESKRKILSYQNGNRGFGDQASKVLIVTSNLEYFTSIGERNQGWIDGGMFSMSLVYALHSLGLGTCCLNWSVEYKKDKLLKLVADIPDAELIIMMIAVGHLPKDLKIAQSPRKPLQEVLIVK
jgi:nitroreductase